jgi:hypothetical protein
MIVTSVAYGFKLDLLQQLAQDQFRIALYTERANLGPETEFYTPEGEVIGPGYSAGGLVLTGFRALLDSFVGPDQVRRVVALVDWEDPVWPYATITARGALIYNFSRGNRTVGAIDLDKNYTSTNGAFSVSLPEPTATTALIRIG